MFKNFITPLLPDFVKFIIDEYEKYGDKVNFCDYFVSKLEMDTILEQSEVLGLNDDNFVRDSLRNILHLCTFKTPTYRQKKYTKM